MHTVPASGLLSASWLLIALPLFGAAVLLLGGRRTDRWGHLLGVATIVVALITVVWFFAFGNPGVPAAP